MGASDPLLALASSVEKVLSTSVGYKDKLDELHILLDLSEEVILTPKDPIWDKFITCLLTCICAPTQTIRATGLRLTRFYYKTTLFLECMLKKNAGYFICASLERSKTSTAERIQALKLVQVMVEGDPLIIPRCIARTIVSIAKQVDDILLSAALKILAELAMANPYLVGSVGGMKVLFYSIIHMERYFESFQSSLIHVATYLLNDIPTRKYVDLNELGIIIEPFTDTYEPSQDTRKRKWTSGTSALAGFLRSWTGLICLAHSPLGLRALVQSLQLQDLYLNDITLDAIFLIFHFPVNRVSEKTFDRAKKINYAEKAASTERGPPERHNLLDNYQAVLLTIMNEFQLFEGLLKIIGRMYKRSADTAETRCIAQKAILLLAELLHLSNRILPASQCAKLQAVPKLMRDAIDFSLDPHFRSLAGTTISDLEKLALTKRTDLTDTSKVDYFDEVKKNFDAQMDESILKQKLNESVLMKKDFSQYNWEIISELIEGPLTNPVHYQSPLVSRFIKKILSFFRPSNKVFPNLPIPGNEKYGRIACVTFDLIISHDNSALLAENQLISEISELLKNATEGNFPEILSVDKLLRTMTISYFEMLGTLSKTKAGVDVLNKHRLFEYLSILAALPSRDDICNLVIQNMNYNVHGPSRVVLAKALNAQSQVVRYLATKRLQVQMRSGIPDFEWGIHYLVQKLSDSNTRVSSFALGILEEAACDTLLLDCLINKRAYDILFQLGKPGKDLLTRFLSRTLGFNYLSSTTFVENELIFWKATGYVTYVKNVESALADAFASSVWRKGSSQVPVPVHLYGELVQTREGIKLLEQKEDLVDFIGLLCSTKATSLQKRGALWVLGHIGKAKLGYKELFGKYDVLKIILHVAKTCTCLAVRGTCFYALGLICSTRSAARALQNLGWECKRESNVCVPVSIANCGIFSLDESQSDPIRCELSPKLEIPSLGDPRDDLIKQFANLSCKLTFDKSLNAIKAHKAQNPDLFQDYSVQYQIFRLMENYHYQLPPRRFFNQIFEVYWSQEKLESIPPYEVKKWPYDSDGFAYFPPLVSSTWSCVEKNRSLRRNSVRGAFGARRPSTVSKEEVPKINKEEATPTSTVTKEPEEPSSLTPANNPERQNSSSVPGKSPRTLIPPPQRRPSPNGRGRPPPRGTTPPRGRGLPFRGRGAPQRPPRRPSPDSNTQ